MSPSGLHVNKPVIAIILGLIVVGIVYFKMSGRGSPDVAEFAQQQAKDTEKQEQAPQVKGAGSDLEKVSVKHVKDLKVKVGDKEVIVAYRETVSDSVKLDVLFLHGMKFKSETWASSPVWTLQLLFKTGGFRAVAIDLPGFGDSPKADVDPAAFIEAVISTLKLNAPVIVSPSMSGGFALPYLFKDPANVLSRSRGYVPVAPVGTDNYKPDQYKALKIPTLVIYGEKDTGIGATAKKNLENLPNRTVVPLPGAGHACYMDKPDEFHKHFLEFLKGLIK